MEIQKWLLEATVLLLAAGWLCLSKPTGRRTILLPSSLSPESYDLALDPDLHRGVFHGAVTISGVAVAETSRIVLHCSNLLLNSTILTDVTDGEEVEVVDLEEDKLLQQCHLLLNRTLKVENEYKLTLEFMGIIGKEGLGLYSDFYKEGGVRHPILMTHMQPNYARTVFPCWDEPHYKAQFLVKVTRGSFPTVISNMPVASVAPPDSGPGGWVEFEETLPMSPYLLVVVWCDYVALTDSSTNNSVWAPRDRLHEAQLALNISSAVLEQCARYFGRDYPLPKLDHIPLPSLSNVAMENWGSITYKQEFLLWEEGVSTWAQREMTAYVVCHEIVHQWLGNLVTTAWWNTTWLNEGVTSFYHYFIMDKIEPTWNVMDTSFVIQIQMILNEEVTRESKPLTNNEPMAQDIIVSSAFSATTYLKGAAITRMVYNLMSPDIFREAIVQYVVDNQFGSVDEEDLWQNVAAVADLPVDLEVVMYSWTHQPGFPLVTVHRSSEGCISVRQEKYLSKDESDIRWTIPLTYTTSEDLDFNLSNTVWFPDDLDYLDLKLCLDPEDWIIVNIRQSGFYRVNYDLQTWTALIHDLLHCDLSNIHPVNRAQLLNDGFDLARHGLLDYHIVLNLSRYLKRESEPLPWAVAIQILNTLRLQVYNTEVSPYFQKYMWDLVDGVYSNVSMTGDLGDLLPETHRRQIVKFACTIGHPRCVKEATVTAYLLMSGVNVKIPLDLKPVLLCAAVQYGQDEVWHYVLKEYFSASDNQRWEYLEAIACTRKPETVDRLLKDVANPSFLHNEDRVNLLIEMGKQDENLGPILDMILARFNLLTSSIEFEVILDVLKSFLKPNITPKENKKIEQLAYLINKRQIPKERDLIEAIIEEMNKDEFEDLDEESVKAWFIDEAKKREEVSQFSTASPPHYQKPAVVNVHNPRDKDEDEEDYLQEIKPTEESIDAPSTEATSLATVKVSSLILTPGIVLLSFIVR